MTRLEHLLTILAEECNEVAHRTAKLLRFGVDDVEPGQELTNREQLNKELAHVEAMRRMLVMEGILPDKENTGEVLRKKLAVERWLLHSKVQGTID